MDDYAPPPTPACPTTTTNQPYDEEMMMGDGPVVRATSPGPTVSFAGFAADGGSSSTRMGGVGTVADLTALVEFNEP